MTVESVKPAAPPAPELREPPRAGGGVPGLGHGWKLARDPLAFMARLRDHGDVVRLKLGPKTVYAVTTPALTGALALSNDFIIAGPLWESLEGLLGKEGVATANGPRHRRQRRTIQPAFRLDAIPAYGPIMEEEAHALTERWKPGETVDCTSESFRVAVRIAARCLLRGDYMDERAERLCVALATVFRGHVPADGGPARAAVQAAAPGQPRIQPGIGRFASPGRRDRRRAPGIRSKAGRFADGIAGGKGREWRPHRGTGDPRPGRRDPHPRQRNRRLHDHVAAAYARGTPGTRGQGARRSRSRHRWEAGGIRGRPGTQAHQQCRRRGHAFAPRRLDSDAPGGAGHGTRWLSHSGRGGHHLQPVRDPA